MNLLNHSVIQEHWLKEPSVLLYQMATLSPFDWLLKCWSPMVSDGLSQCSIQRIKMKFIILFFLSWRFIIDGFCMCWQLGSHGCWCVSGVTLGYHIITFSLKWVAADFLRCANQVPSGRSCHWNGYNERWLWQHCGHQDSHWSSGKTAHTLIALALNLPRYFELSTKWTVCDSSLRVLRITWVTWISKLLGPRKELLLFR